MATQVIGAGVLGRAASAAVTNATNAKPWNVAMWIGTALVLIGWSDVIMGMYPYRVGNPDWEFGAISAALDSMALGTIGIAAAAIGALVSGRRRMLQAISLFTGLVVGFLVSAIVLYGLSIPVILKAVPAAMQTQFSIAIAKALLLAVTYSFAHIVVFRESWRGASVNARA